MNPGRARRVAITLAVMACCGSCWDAEPAERPAQPTEVAVHLATIVRATLCARVDAYGSVEPEPAGGGEPAGAARLAAPAPGIVISVPVAEGQRVEAGTVVVVLNDRVARARLDSAGHLLELAEQRVLRQKALQAIGGTSGRALQEATQQLASAKDDVAAAEGQLALVQLASPIAGVVAAIRVQPGQTVEPRTVVAEVVDPDRLVLTVQVPLSEAAAVSVGRPAELLGESTGTSARGAVSSSAPRWTPGRRRCSCASR